MEEKGSYCSFYVFQLGFGEAMKRDGGILMLLSRHVYSN